MPKIADEVLERLAALEAAIGIGHDDNGPSLDADELPPNRKAGLISDRLVAKRYDVHPRTLARWDLNPGLKFPKPVYILRRRYRNVALLDQWDRANARKVADPHSPHRDVAKALPRAQRGRFDKPDDTRR